MKLLSVEERLNILRGSKPYKLWKEKILERDLYQCVLCKNKKDLEVDHIKPVALFPKLSLDLENGRVLCKKCHKKTDTYGAFSKFKGNSPIHPVFSGDLLFKLKSLPQTIQPYNSEIGLSLTYLPKEKKWRMGYKFAKTNLTVKEENIEDVVDNLFEKLKDSTYYQSAPFSLE